MEIQQWNTTKFPIKEATTRTVQILTGLNENHCIRCNILTMNFFSSGELIELWMSLCRLSVDLCLWERAYTISIKCSLCLPCSCEVIYNFSSLPSRYFPIPFWDFPCNLHVRRVASYKDFSCINLPNVGWEECLLCCEFPSPNSLSIFYTCKTLWIQFLCRLYVWDEKHVCCNFTALERGLSVFDCSSACSMPVWNSGFCLKLWILLWLG